MNLNKQNTLLLIISVFLSFFIIISSSFADEKTIKENKISLKIGDNSILVDNLIYKFENENKSLSTKHKIEKYKVIISRTYSALDRINNSYMTKAKKQLYVSILTYLLVKAEESVNSLEYKKVLEDQDENEDDVN